MYLANCCFEIQTDHRPLICMNSKCFTNDRLTRWSLMLQSYKYTITYIKGSDNIVSDYMSRINYPEVPEQSNYNLNTEMNEVKEYDNMTDKIDNKSVVLLNTFSESQIKASSLITHDLEEGFGPCLDNLFKVPVCTIESCDSYTTIEGIDKGNDSLMTISTFPTTDVVKLNDQ